MTKTKNPKGAGRPKGSPNKKAKTPESIKFLNKARDYIDSLMKEIKEKCGEK